MKPIGCRLVVIDPTEPIAINPFDVEKGEYAISRLGHMLPDEACAMVIATFLQVFHLLYPFGIQTEINVAELGNQIFERGDFVKILATEEK